MRLLIHVGYVVKPRTSDSREANLNPFGLFHCSCMLANAAVFASQYCSRCDKLHAFAASILAAHWILPQQHRVSPYAGASLIVACLFEQSFRNLLSSRNYRFKTTKYVNPTWPLLLANDKRPHSASNSTPTSNSESCCCVNEETMRTTSARFPSCWRFVGRPDVHS